MILESGVHGDLHSRFVRLADQEETIEAGSSKRSWFPFIKDPIVAAEYEGDEYRYEPQRAPELKTQEVDLFDLRLTYRGIFGEAEKSIAAVAVLKGPREGMVDEEMRADLEANSSAQVLSEIVSRTGTMKTILQGEVDHQNQNGAADVGVLTG